MEIAEDFLETRGRFCGVLWRILASLEVSSDLQVPSLSFLKSRKSGLRGGKFYLGRGVGGCESGAESAVSQVLGQKSHPDMLKDTQKRYK